MNGFNAGRRAVLGGLAAAPLISRASAQGTGASGDPYIVGTLFPMSGPNAEYGSVFTAGAALAVQHINADSLLRRPTRIQAEDTQALPQQGVIGMTKLVNVDRAHYVLAAFTAVSKAAAGGSLVGQFSVPRTAQQFAPVAARIRQTRPDAIYIASFGAQQSQIIKQLRDNGVSQPLVSYSAMNIDSVRNTPEAEGLIFTTQSTDFEGGDAITRRFATDFKARHNADPGTYQTNYYNAVRLFGLLAQSLERENAEVNGENLRRMLLATREFDLVGGKARFDELGNMSAALQINEVRGGRVVKIA